MSRALVVGAVVVDALERPGRVLAARRSGPAELRGQWEFPGGKVEPGETPQAALVRELQEELGATVRVGAEIAHPDGTWPISDRYELRLFLAEVVEGTARPGSDHDELRWLEPNTLDILPWLPADAAALSAVRATLLRRTSTATLPWPLPDRPELRDRLVEAYGVGRGYHDLLHLTEVLARQEELGGADDDVLVLAAWFHDAVYDGRPDDEERSARLAEAELADLPEVAEVARLVRLTATHEPEPDDRRGAMLCDADLGILAASPQRYAAYVAGVRQDHASVGDEAFRTGRLAVLEELAGRQQLFRTDHARTHWEPIARRNLAAEIAALRR